MAMCIRCHKDYSDKRHLLGYELCLECGEEDAQYEKERKKKQVAVLVNKSAYQYICTKEELKTIGRRRESF